MKKICLYLFFLLSFLLNPIAVLAQNQTPTATPAPGSDIPEIESPASQADFDDFKLDPPQFPSSKDDTYYITDFTKSVKVTFPGLPAGGDYKVCLRNDYCITNWGILIAESHEIPNILSSVGIPIDEQKNLKDAEDVFEENTATLIVCGDGNNKLKADKDRGCDDDDYFHAGNFYLVTVYDTQDDRNVAVARAGFYVSHAIPDVDIIPKTGLTPPVPQFEVQISQSVIRPGDKEDRNNYQVVLEGVGKLKQEKCGHVESTTSPLSLTFTPENESNGFSVPGTYTFKINEQNDEGGFLGSGIGGDCSGGFTYMHINCTIGTDNNKNQCVKIVDPNGEDAKELLNLLNIINGQNENAVPLPCSKSEGFVTNPLDCDSVDTSIGPIAVDPVGFITRLFSIVLSIAGLGAMIIIIYSGYRLLISRGDKEKIQGARETLTSAIIGLLFIIFSFVILSVIAGNILRIPGFS